jgi:hypothetical protein
LPSRGLMRLQCFPHDLPIILHGVGAYLSAIRSAAKRQPRKSGMKVPLVEDNAADIRMEREKGGLA